MSPLPTTNSATKSSTSSSATDSTSIPTLPPVSTSTAPSTMLNLNSLWIPILIVLSKDMTASATNTDAANDCSEDSMLRLPSQNQSVVDFPGTSSSCPALNPKLNYRPVIGILSHPGDGASGRLNNGTNVSYIAASYVKFVESAGARVIPLIYNEPPGILYKIGNGQLLGFWSREKRLVKCLPLSWTFQVRDQLGIWVLGIKAIRVPFKLNLVNGVLFTGGWAKSGLYFDVVEAVFKKVLEKNDAGEHFPVLAICLGFELLAMIISKDRNILEQFSAADQASTLQFMENTSIQGTVFQRFPPELLKKLSTDCLVMQNHHYGISPQTFNGSADLCSFFNVLTTSADENNKVYVSSVQAKKYPVTAFQWHPEKNAFEWGLSMIPHSEDAIQVTQHVANYFVSEARKSLNRPPTSTVLDNLIYNYSPTYCGKSGRGYDEVYIFSDVSKL